MPWEEQLERMGAAVEPYRGQFIAVAPDDRILGNDPTLAGLIAKLSPDWEGYAVFIRPPAPPCEEKV